ncbi:hypothetical protein RFI_10969, partial [Reticulomyxa filosa]
EEEEQEKEVMEKEEENEEQEEERGDTEQAEDTEEHVSRRNGYFDDDSSFDVSKKLHLFEDIVEEAKHGGQRDEKIHNERQRHSAKEPLFSKDWDDEVEEVMNRPKKKNKKNEKPDDIGNLQIQTGMPMASPQPRTLGTMNTTIEHDHDDLFQAIEQDSNTDHTQKHSQANTKDSFSFDDDESPSKTPADSKGQRDPTALNNYFDINTHAKQDT